MKGLLVKALGGLLMLLIALSAFLFIPAGSINYWQGWMYLLAFAVPVLLITLYLLKNDPGLLERRVEAGPAAEKEKSQQVIQALASVFFAFVYIIAGLDYRFHWSAVPFYLSLIADALVILGLYIVFLVFKENSYTSAIIEVNKEQKVISTGPYRFVRHPMYSGALFMMFFSPLALGSYWAFLGVFPLAASIIMRLFEEEKYLANHLPGYVDYCQKVHYHLIPYLW